jgi:hypothetical protein
MAGRLELAVSVSAGEGVDVWDLATGTLLRGFNIPSTSPQLAMMDDHHFIMPQIDRPRIHTWAWRHGNTKQKSSVAEVSRRFGMLLT